MPKVSVIMPVYNAGRFLQPALDSILRQTFGDFELICVDDGSDDGSFAVLSETVGRDKRVRVERQDRGGIVVALNRGCRAAQGELIARMDSDDWAEPDRLARQVAYLARHPDIALVGSAYVIIDERDRMLKTVQPPLDPPAVAAALLQGNCIAHPTVMMRRAALGALTGPYRPALRHAEDYDLWLRLSEQVPLANLPDLLLRYRRRTDVVRLGQFSEQGLAMLAARRLAELRRAGGRDDADAWTELTQARLAELGIGVAEQRREIRRMALAYARLVRQAGNREAARQCLEFVAQHAPRGEGFGAWIDYRLRRAKVWI